MRDVGRVVTGMGWLCVAVGVWLLAMPRRVAGLFGMGDRPGILAAIGVRDLVIGAGLLLARDPRPWMGARVAGDLVDLSVMSLGLTRLGFARGRAITGALISGGFLLFDIWLTAALTSEPGSEER